MTLGAVSPPDMRRSQTGACDQAMTACAVLAHPRGMGNRRWRSGPGALACASAIDTDKVTLGWFNGSRERERSRWYMALRAIGQQRMAHP